LVWPWDKERACDDKIGRYQKFKNGCIHWHPTLGAFETHGSICTKWNNNKQEKGFLGYPISDEMDWSADDLLRMLPVNWEDLHDPKFNWPPWLAYTVFPSKLTQLGRWSKFERGVKQVKEAEANWQESQAIQLFILKCITLTEEANRIDPRDSRVSMRLNQLELRFAQLLSSLQGRDTPKELSEASDSIRDIKIKSHFYKSLKDFDFNEHKIKESFDSIRLARSQLSRNIVKGSIFEEIDNNMSVCGTYYMIRGEHTSSVFKDECNAIPQKEYLELKTFIAEKQIKVYNSWALNLITETKKEYQHRSPTAPIPGTDPVTPLVKELFPKAFNVIDDSLLLPSVSRLYNDFQHTLLDEVKNKYDLVEMLLFEQLSSTKKTIYQIAS